MLNIAELNRQIRVLSSFAAEVCTPNMKKYNNIADEINNGYNIILECLTDRSSYSILVVSDTTYTFPISDDIIFTVEPNFADNTATITNGTITDRTIETITLPSYLIYKDQSSDQYYLLTITSINKLFTSSDTATIIQQLTLPKMLVSYSSDIFNVNITINNIDIYIKNISTTLHLPKLSSDMEINFHDTQNIYTSIFEILPTTSVKTRDNDDSDDPIKPTVSILTCDLSDTTITILPKYFMYSIQSDVQTVIVLNNNIQHMEAYSFANIMNINTISMPFYSNVDIDAFNGDITTDGVVSNDMRTELKGSPEDDNPLLLFYNTILSPTYTPLTFNTVASTKVVYLNGMFSKTAGSKTLCLVAPADNMYTKLNMTTVSYFTGLDILSDATTQ